MTADRVEAFTTEHTGAAPLSDPPAANPGSGAGSIASAMLVLAIAAGTTLAAFDQSSWVWGLGGYGPLPVAALAIATVLLLVTLIPAVARVVTRVVVAAPIPCRGVGPFIIGALAVPCFWLARSAVLVGDWRLVIERLSVGYYYPSNLWTNYCHRLANAMIGGTADDAIAATSAIAGGVFVTALLRLAGRVTTDRPAARSIFWLTALPSTSLIFFGHIEVYAPLIAAVLVFFDLALCAREGRVPLALPGLALGVAVCFHGLAALCAPAWFVAVWRWAPPGLRARHTLLSGIAFTSPIFAAAGVLFFGHWQASAPGDPALRYGTFLGAAGQSPITPIARESGYVYAMSEVGHWRDRLNVFLRLAPIGLMLALIQFRPVRRASRPARGTSQADFRGFIGLCAIIGLAWAAVHNVSYPVDHDWDLFALVAVVLSLLGALGAVRATASTTGRLLAMTMFASAGWWTSTVFPSDLVRVDYHRSLRDVYQRLGETPAFERHLIAAASIGEIPDRGAILDAGIYFISRRRWVEAERFFTRGAEATPFLNDRDLQANYALLAYRRGRYGLAIDRMQRALHRDPTSTTLNQQFGQILFEAQQFQRAYKHYKRAADLEPKNHALTYAAVEIAKHPQVNARPEALRMLTRLSEHHPEDVDVLNALFKLHRVIGSIDTMAEIQERLRAIYKKRQAERR